jgi:hypothetical protein
VFDFSVFNKKFNYIYTHTTLSRAGDSSIPTFLEKAKKYIKKKGLIVVVDLTDSKSVENIKKYSRKLKLSFVKTNIIYSSVKAPEFVNDFIKKYNLPDRHFIYVLTRKEAKDRLSFLRGT